MPRRIDISAHPKNCGAAMLTTQIVWCSLRASTRPRQTHSRNSSVLALRKWPLSWAWKTLQRLAPRHPQCTMYRRLLQASQENLKVGAIRALPHRTTPLGWQSVERAIKRSGKFRDDLLNLRLRYIEGR